MHKITVSAPASMVRSQMAPFIAVAKLEAVGRMMRKAEIGTEQAALNACLLGEALHMARQGRSQDAFRHLSRAKVPAGSTPACCGLRSAMYGCATHGYPRTK